MEIVSSVPLFVAVGFALTFLRRYWRWCGLLPAVVVGRRARLKRIESGRRPRRYGFPPSSDLGVRVG